MAEDHTNDLGNSPAFRLDQPIPKGVVAIEASAGTGKTFTLASLAVRLILEEEVPIAQVLLVTFTRAAAAELAERVRARLLRCGSALAAAIDGHYPDSGALLEYSLAGPEVGQDLLRSRLSLAQRALSEFDSATISTIHGFAQQMLGLMGPKLANRDFDAGIEARLHHKDFGLVMNMADQQQLPMPALHLVHAQLEKLMQHGWGNMDTCNLLRVLEEEK